MFGIDIPGWVVAGLLLLLLVAIGTLILSSIGKKAADAATTITINSLVKQECLTGNQGEFPIDLTRIPDISTIDFATHGFSLENASGVVKWRKVGRTCKYKIVLTGTSDGSTATHELPEQTVENCPV